VCGECSSVYIEMGPKEGFEHWFPIELGSGRPRSLYLHADNDCNTRLLL
jgi:hypothetical protein